MDNFGIETICKVCNEEFDDYKKLHLHLRSHKLKVEEYYHKYFPKKDLLDGSNIEFKNPEQYFNTDFNSRTNLRKWVFSEDKNIVKQYCKECLLQRSKYKNYIYSPTQFELRTSLVPPINVFEKFGIDYLSYCKQIGLTNRFIICVPKEVPNKIRKNTKIFIDSREKKPLVLKYPTEVKGLKFGDYALDKPLYSDCSVIERKSLADLILTVSGKNLTRFKKEIEKCKEAQGYMFILIEEDFNKFAGFNYLPHIYKKTKVTPEFIAHNIKDLLQTYDNIQFAFCKGRKHTAELVKRILFNGKFFKQVDVQLLIDLKLI